MFISIERIEKSRQLLFTNEDAPKHYLDDRRIKDAWLRSLSTVHPDSSKLIPAFFRPAAFLPATAPLVFLMTVPRTGIKSMILPQLPFYGYTTTFNIINGNTSYHPGHVERVVLGTGAFASSTFFGALLHLVHMKYRLENIWIKRVLPAFILAQISGLNVFLSRGFEHARGIEVMDKEGNVVGHSKVAARKAVKETAISRAVLFGTSAFIPEIFIHFIKRTQFFPQTPRSLWTLKMVGVLLVMGLVVPMSFSMFPQVGKIQCSKLEEEVRFSTEETELFYNRGV